MAKVAIFEDAQQRWIDFDEDTEVLIEYLDKPAALELSKEVDKLVARTGSDRMPIWNQKLGERVVKSWRKRTDHNHPGLIRPSGEPIPFTAENRDMMMKHCREFSSFVGENSIDAKVFLEIQRQPEEQEKIKND
jgi:hypothetical protein